MGYGPWGLNKRVEHDLRCNDLSMVVRVTERQREIKVNPGKMKKSSQLSYIGRNLNVSCRVQTIKVN